MKKLLALLAVACTCTFAQAQPNYICSFVQKNVTDIFAIRKQYPNLQPEDAYQAAIVHASKEDRKTIHNIIQLAFLYPADMDIDDVKDDILKKCLASK